MPNIAGSLDLSTVIETLSARRPVFHSEADFQFAFAQAVVAADPDIQVRLEIRATGERVIGGRAEYIDLACWTPRQRTLIEFKYATARWEGTDPHGEDFYVRNHSAYDLARRYYVHDIYRLERFTTAQPDTDGLAIMLTNEPSLWTHSDSAKARDRNFRIHEGTTLTGHLEWGFGDSPKYNQWLDGTYTTRWHDYYDLGGTKGRFRWLAVPIEAQA